MYCNRAGQKRKRGDARPARSRRKSAKGCRLRVGDQEATVPSRAREKKVRGPIPSREGTPREISFYLVLLMKIELTSIKRGRTRTNGGVLYNYRKGTSTIKWVSLSFPSTELGN